MKLQTLIQNFSPELQNFIHQKLANISDEDLMCLANAFSPYPAITRKPRHPDSDDWFVVPEYLSAIPHSKPPLAEGIRMITWQNLVFAEVHARGLGQPEFWSKERIQYERKDLVELALRGDPLKNAKDIYYDPDQDDADPMGHFMDADEEYEDFELEEGPTEISMSNEELDEFEGAA